MANVLGKPKADKVRLRISNAGASSHFLAGFMLAGKITVVANDGMTYFR
jgi:FtsP/CotA-like multicopper oxidase with cupredoxin domain